MTTTTLTASASRHDYDPGEHGCRACGLPQVNAVHHDLDSTVARHPAGSAR